MIRRLLDSSIVIHSNNISKKNLYFSLERLLSLEVKEIILPLSYKINISDSRLKYIDINSSKSHVINKLVKHSINDTILIYDCDFLFSYESFVVDLSTAIGALPFKWFCVLNEQSTHGFMSSKKSI